MKNTAALSAQIPDKITEILDEIIAIRRDFHAHPELSGQEERTAAKVSEYLTAWGIPHETGVAGHGIVGLIGSKGSHTVALRADMDALPIQEMNDIPYRSLNSGVMHACGHDIHTAVLLGAAKILKSMENELPGRVKLLFQPAEETVGGAESMIQAGCLENPKVDAVLGLHVEPRVLAGAVEFRRGAMNAASDPFVITVKGVSSHGARPEDGVDAVLAASQIVCSLQSFVSRNIAAADAAVVTVGKFQAGTASNIIASEATLTGIIRTLDPAVRDRARKRVEEIACLTAQAYGAAATVEYVESNPPLINDDDIETIMEETAAKMLSPEQICFRPTCSMGAEDFAYFCEAVKSTYYNIGTKTNPQDPTISLHNGHYCPDERCIRVGILMQCAGALSVLEHCGD